MPSEHRAVANPAGNWTGREAHLLALIGLLLGVAVGYLVRGSSSPAVPPVEAAMPGAGSPGEKAPLHSAEAVKPLAAPLLAVLQSDPKNADILVQLGNLYYDHHVYSEAIEYYRRALELRPKDANVRTDLGTAYWYSGFPDKAVAEYEEALAAQPAYSPTLLNLGIVRLEGFKDAAGAVAAWEELLRTNPEHPEKQRVLDLIARAKSQKG